MRVASKKVLYDCDNTMGLPHKEIDDGLTLLYLLGRPDVDVLGVTTVFGNGTVDEAYSQTKYWLQSLNPQATHGHKDIAVYKGASERGQGNTEAAHFLAETAAAYPGEVTMLATGPLSNLRAAAELDPMFFSNLRHIACMGGYLHTGGLYPRLRIGWRKLPELNLSADPEAAWRVLNVSRTASACPVTLMNAHVCLQAPFGWRDLRIFKAWNRELHATIRHWLMAFGAYCGVLVFYLWDLLPAVYLSYPELFDVNWIGLNSTVQDLETGSLITETPGRYRGLNMPTEILDPEQFKAILFESWKRILHAV